VALFVAALFVAALFVATLFVATLFVAALLHWHFHDGEFSIIVRDIYHTWKLRTDTRLAPTPFFVIV